MRLFLVVFALACFACGKDTPVPEYPFPEQTPLEETDLAQYVGGDDLDAEEDEEWDDGLSDEDLEMGDGNETEPEAAPETPEGEQPAESAEQSAG